MSSIDPADVSSLVTLARRVVAPTWGLDHFVAVNPLQGFEHLTFEAALDKASDLFGSEGYLTVEQRRRMATSYDIEHHHLRAALAEHGIEPDGDDDGVAWCLADRRVTTMLLVDRRTS
jgi:uncharacterized protein